MRQGSFVSIVAAMLLVQSGYALSGPAAPTSARGYGGGLIEGRAVYEAQVNFGGARENDLGPGWDFGVPPRAESGTQGSNMTR